MSKVLMILSLFVSIPLYVVGLALGVGYRVVYVGFKTGYGLLPYSIEG